VAAGGEVGGAGRRGRRSGPPGEVALVDEVVEILVGGDGDERVEVLVGELVLLGTPERECR
jgi:hypothetical protein